MKELTIFMPVNIGIWLYWYNNSIWKNKDFSYQLIFMTLKESYRLSNTEAGFGSQLPWLEAHNSLLM